LVVKYGYKEFEKSKGVWSMKISFHGHSVILVEANGTRILFDPFINGNPATDLKVEEVKADVIIVTHGHNDHLGDTVELAKKNNALVIGTAELADYLGAKGINTHGLHIGGGFNFEFGRVKLTQAFHGSGYVNEKNEIVYLGMPAGVLLTINGKTIYHAGDTGLFSDMKLIGDRNQIDVAFLPIGDNFTMGPDDAAYAAELLQAKKVVPIHYDTFPLLKQNPQAFVSMLPTGMGVVLKVGQSIEL
jgi:L-ascorbate metabolism protein UlaG (beta-lactamase superfamily)